MSMNLKEKKMFIFTHFAQAAMSIGILSSEEREKIRFSKSERELLSDAVDVINAMIKMNDLCSLRDVFIESLRNDSESIFKEEL